MKTHSSTPTKGDNIILSYIRGKEFVNMPLKSKSQVKIFKNPAFTLIGIWIKKK